MVLLIQVKRWLVNISVRTTVRHCTVLFASSLSGESDFLRASHYFISLVARHSWGCSPMKFLSSGKPEITFIGYWLSHLQLRRFPMGRNIYRSHCHPANVLCNAGRLSQFLPRLLLPTRVDGKSCPLAGFHRLLISARHHAGSFK